MATNCNLMLHICCCTPIELTLGALKEKIFWKHSHFFMINEIYSSLFHLLFRPIRNNRV